MREQPMTKEVARRFLLGAVDDSERQQIEALFVADPSAQETILRAEDDLLEDYLEGSLSESDSARFRDRFASGPRQQRKLRITSSIRDYALSEAMPDRASPSAIEKLRHLISSTALQKPRFYIPVAIALMVLVIAAVWSVQWNTQRMRNANSRLALEQELIDLNSPTNRNQKQSQMLSVVLPPVSLRSINQSSEVVSQSVDRLIELQLLLPHKQESQGYTAVLRRVGSTDEFTIANLLAEKSLTGSVVKLRLPAKSLPIGHYEISLSGTSDGPIEQYDFVIAG